jgi:hypothetical protein
LLASEYGWSKRDILEDVYLDEFIYLREEIAERRKRQSGFMPGEDDKYEPVNSTDYLYQEGVDKNAFEKMKFVMQENPRIMVK